MALPRQHKGAPRKGAPFAFWLSLCLFLASSWASAAPQCGIERSDDTVTVTYVYDGDTVKLNDGRKIRFIGINTPEINHRGGEPEPFAQAARKRLQQLLGKGRQLRLRYGRERHDRYGRALAHPYLKDGRSLNALLLQQGLATTLVVPPNTWNYGCYQGVEQKARRQRIGLWSLPRYHVTPLSSLYQGAEGYHLIRAKIIHVGESRRSIWLDLNGPAALRIPRADLQYFHEIDLDNLAGKEVVARGWWHADKKGHWRMTLRHPAALALQ